MENNFEPCIIAVSMIFNFNESYNILSSSETLFNLFLPHMT